MSLITEVDILDEARDNFLTYAEEVLADRAIPSAEDGLLSSQRKILWTMEDYLKMNSKGKTKKCNAIVGSTLATSYFHGDASCYGVLCKMSQEYLMRYPLIKGQGSLGTQENNDFAASSRYTEAKPSIYADLMMTDFKKNVVPLKETYNGEFMEPVILPSLFPNAICNGRQAIGISMSHGSLPHNLTEVCNAIIAYIEKGSLTVDELMQYVQGPDFPLKNTIINKEDVREAFVTGKSKTSLKVRGCYEIDGQKIIFTTIPYRTYRNKIKEQIEKNIDELDTVIDDFEDESNLNDNKLVFYVKSGVSPLSAVNKLFALTDLQTTVSYNMNYIVNGTPKLCSMTDLIGFYVKHQSDIIMNIAKFDKDKAEKRKHIIEGLLIALNDIDTAIALIKNSNNRAEAEAKLINKFSITEIQAKAILDMKLVKLTKLDKDELLDELKSLIGEIAECDHLISDEGYRNIKVAEKVTDMRNKFGDERRTELTQIKEEPKAKKAAPEVIPEDCVILVSENNMIKRIPSKSFKTQKRNTIGVKNNNDIVKFSCKTNTVDNLMVFSSVGKLYRYSVANIPESTNAAKGIAITNLIEFGPNETPMAYGCFNQGVAAKYVVFATKNGIIKKVIAEEYLNVKRTGTKAITLKEGDSLSAVTFANDEDIMLFTKHGMSIRFNSSSMPLSSRTAQGVKGIALNEDDYVIACVPVTSNSTLAILAEDNCGRRCEVSEFPTQNRGGKGVSCCKSDIASVFEISDDDKVLLIGNKTSICIAATDLPVLSRTSVGNILIKNNEKCISGVKA